MKGLDQKLFVTLTYINMNKTGTSPIYFFYYSVTNQKYSIPRRQTSHYRELLCVRRSFVFPDLWHALVSCPFPQLAVGTLIG